MDVVKKEIMKLLEAGIISPISDSTWLQGVKESVTDVDSRYDRLEGLIMALREEVTARMDGLESDLAICRRAAAVGLTTPVGGQVDVLRPGWYNGARDAQKVESFDNLNLIEGAAKITAVTSYLTDTAMLWWRRKHADIERGAMQLDTWDEFKRELKRQFYPENVVYEAQKKLRELRQKGAIRDYVKEFTNLTLQIPNLSEEDLVFFFTDDLQNWAKQELQRWGIRTVDEAIAVAKFLNDYRKDSPPDSFNRKDKEKVGSRGGRERRDHHRPPRPGRSEKFLSRDKYEAKKKSLAPRGGCFVCKGPHAMKECPKLGSLSAIVEQQEVETHAETSAKMGSLQLLNALRAVPAAKTMSKGLMYVEAQINGKIARVMVDTGATHNFMATDEARRLEIQWDKWEGWLKTVNAKAQP
ncbi:hypothetical protein EUTSA_v10024067mg, partial [Eutrema salsugineum]